jgi:O-antigen/teichoic acid export membrane protein
VREQAIKGSLWLVLESAGAQALSFASFLVLARLLLPEDYGAFGLASALITMPGTLLEEGIGDALIQRQRLDNEHINAAFWANLFLAGTLVLLAQIAAPWAATLTSTPIIEPVLRVVSLALLFSALQSIASALHRKNLHYSQFALRTFVSTLSASAVGLALAFAGFGVWSLVALQFIGAAVGAIALWRGISWRPKLRFSLAALGDITRVALGVMTANLVRFANDKADVIIIGLFLDTRSLGYYYLAQRLLYAIYWISISPVNLVMMPVLAKMQDDRRRITQTYVRMVWGAAAVWTPAVAGLGLICPILVPLFFGDKWAGAIPIMMITSLSSLSVALLRPTQAALTAMGKPSLYAHLAVIQLAIAIPLLLAGVSFGIAGAALAYVAVGFAMIPFHLAVVGRATGLSPVDLLKKYLSVIAAAGVMSAMLLLMIAMVSLSPWEMLAAEIIVGGTVYILALYLLSPHDVVQVASTVHDVLPARLRFRGL